MSIAPGPRNLITDVPGIRVGNATDEGVRTGVTVLCCETSPAAAVDVRGGGPGVRETDVLAPENLVGRADAIVLSGGSVFGLGAADGVAAALSARGVGLSLRAGAPAIPIVPAAVLHDLGNGGNKAWGLDPPYRTLGLKALEAAGSDFALGSVGAGRGAFAGTIKGGLGSVSIDLGEGLIVGALVAVNAVGSVLMADGETFWAWPFEINGEFGGRRPQGDVHVRDPFPAEGRFAASGSLKPATNTVIGIVATTARLSTAALKRVAIMAHDGIARAVRPSHSIFDGDTVFAVSTGTLAVDEAQRAMMIARVGAAAADCLARAIARGVFQARG